MKNLLQQSLLSIGGIGMLIGVQGCSSEKTGKKPNIIFIMADDLGYGDLGCFGSTKIETPNIDNLAKNGKIFTQYYSGSPVSAPSRCVLLTGLHSGKSQIRSNDEWPSRGNVRDYLAQFADSTLEGQRPVAAGTFTIGTMLQKAGYKTALVGKWGLGAPHTDGIPNRQGFDFFFGYNCQRQAHTYYPLHLYKNERRYLLKNDTVPFHTLLDEGADPLDQSSYSKYTLAEYAPEVMFREARNFVNENKDHPFFLYWAPNIPHVPLQATQKWVDHYVEKFGDEKPYTGEKQYFPQRYPHAAYAALISYLDEQVGELVAQLRELGIYDNTLIFFTSDNGPAPNGGSDSPWFASAGPFSAETGLAKGNLNEGGIRVPMIVSWPGVIDPGTLSEHPCVAYDIMPTLAEVTGADIRVQADGLSFLPALKGKKQKQHEFLYWEFVAAGGQMAVRMGDFKVLRKNMNKGDLKWQLFDLKNDPREQKDISSQYPEIIKKADDIVAKEHTRSELFRFKGLGE